MRTVTWMCGLFIAASAVGCSSSSGGGTDGGDDVKTHPVSDAGHDGASDATRDSGHDAGHDAVTDAIVDTGPDLDAAVGLTCAKLVACDNACGTSGTCTDTCYAEATGVAQGLFNAFNACISANCPSGDGGVCAMSSSTACSNCNQEQATTSCVTGLGACLSDTKPGPPDPDGGGVVVVHVDAGKSFNCGELIACQAACSLDAGPCAMTCSNEATPEARALAGTLSSCLAMACPAVDGGPCQMQGLACSGCIEQVELAEPDTCATPYIACNADTSNSPDGGSTPKPLVDGGVLTTLVKGLDQAASTIVASNGYLYFTQVVSGSPILRIPLTDGGTVEQLGPPQATPVSLAVDSTNAYVWSVGTFELNSSTNNKDGTVVQVPLGGGAAVTLAQNVEVLYDAAYLNAIAIDAKNVYWVAGANGSDGTIMKTAIGSASPTAIFSGQLVPQALTTDGTNVYWADWGTFNAQGDPNTDGTIWQGPVGGGTAIMLAANQSAPSAIAVDGTHVYWSNLGPLGGDNLPQPNGGSVMKVAIGGGTVTTIASAQAVPVAIALAGTNLYWSQYGLSAPGLIMTTPTAGGAVTPIAAGLDDPAAIAIAGKTIYWTNANSSPTNGSISALTPF